MMGERVHVVSMEWLTVGAAAYGVVMLLSLMAGPSVLDNFHADQFLFFLVLVGLLVIVTLGSGERSMARIRTDAAHMAGMRGVLARPDAANGSQLPPIRTQAGHMPLHSAVDTDATARLYAAMAKNDRQRQAIAPRPAQTAMHLVTMGAQGQPAASVASSDLPAVRRIVRRSPQRQIVGDIVVRGQANGGVQRSRSHRQYSAFRPRMTAVRPALRTVRSIDGFLPTAA